VELRGAVEIPTSLVGPPTREEILKAINKCREMLTEQG
jgi:hypothetical protein